MATLRKPETITFTGKVEKGLLLRRMRKTKIRT